MLNPNITTIFLSYFYLAFPEIEGVNAGSDCFNVLGMPTLGLLGPQFMKK
jgi:hypothetical protein